MKEEEKINILLIEDNAGDAKLIEIMLHEADAGLYKITNATNFKDGMSMLQEQDFHIVLLDLSLPDSFGLETITNANELVPNVPIIVLTGRNDDDFALEVVRSGAQDYLVKGQIESAVLSRAVRYAIKRKELEVDLKETTRQIEETESRLNVIVNNNLSGIVVLDKNKTIKFHNPAAEKMLGEEGKSLIGKQFELAFSLDDASMIPIKNGRMLIEIIAVQTNWGGESSTLITIHDITDLKRAEESLRIKNNELTRINKALDRFVYIISHDLKKPTANIIGLLTLYEKELVNKESPRSKLIYEKLNFSALQLKKMIEDLLEATKHEINTDEQNFELIDFNKLYNEVSQSIDQLIAQSDAEIVTDFSKYPFFFYSYNDLKSIMGNLLSNAIKYSSPKRKPKIEISTEKTPEGPMLSIKDNGIGIDLEHEAGRLFKKYQRFSNQAEGTGIGLWIVKEVVEKNGGKVQVESHVDQGTIFRIIF